MWKKFFFFLSFYSLFAYNKESGKFLGNMLALGNDGALEVVENPAYLSASLADLKGKWLFAIEGAGGLGYQLKLEPYREEDLQNLQKAQYNLALATGGHGWATGFFWGTPQSIPWQNLIFSFREGTLRREIQEKTIFEEFSWSLSRQIEKGHFVGFALGGMIGFRGEATALRSNFFDQGTLVDFSQYTGSQRRFLGGKAILGYLGETKDSEFGASCRLFSFGQIRSESFGVSESWSLGVFLKQEDRKFDEYSIIIPPECAIGLSYQIFPFLKTFFEFTGSLALKEKDKIFNFENGKILTYETSDPAGSSQSFTAGFSYPILKEGFLLSGVKYFWKNSDRVYKADDQAYTSLRRGFEKKLQISTGMVYKWTSRFALLAGFLWGWGQNSEEQKNLKQNQISQENFSLELSFIELHLALRFLLG